MLDVENLLLLIRENNLPSIINSILSKKELPLGLGRYFRYPETVEIHYTKDEYGSFFGEDLLPLWQDASYFLTAFKVSKKKYIVFYPQNSGDEGLYNLVNWEQLMSHHFKEFHLFPGISHAQLRQVAPLFEYENVEYLISVLEGKTDEAEFLQSIEDT